MTVPATITVGISGTPRDRAVLDHAVRECAARGTRLHILHAAPAPIMAPTDIEQAEFDRALRRATARRMATDALRYARHLDPELTVSMAVDQHRPYRALIDAAEHSVLIVVGQSRRPMGTAERVATAVHCPVIVVPPTVGDSVGVLVGLDEGGLAADALEFACEEARLRHWPLSVVHVVVPALVAVGSHRADESAHVLAEPLTRCAARYPDLRITPHALHGNPSEVLCELTASAGLLVVGTHGRGVLGELLLGSVSRALIHSARCPVAVVRPTGAATP